MNKAIDEIGYWKAIKFLVLSIIYFVFRLVIFPPIRSIILKFLGASISSNSVIMNIKLLNLHHKGIGSLKIGKKCFIGDETMLDLYDSITLEDCVTLAQRVLVLTHTNVGYKDHPLQKYFPKSAKPVIFKSGCVIGASSLILPGVIVGERSFVAAGSVVTKNVPKNSLVAGVPAKIIRKLNK